MHMIPWIVAGERKEVSVNENIINDDGDRFQEISFTDKRRERNECQDGERQQLDDSLMISEPFEKRIRADLFVERKLA